MKNIRSSIRNGRASEKGSALVYILIAIALLAALTVSFMEPSSQQTSSQNTFRTVTALQGQIDTIRSAIQECVLIYPNGDSAVTDAGFNNPYPAFPDSTYLDAGYRAANKNAEFMRCPGNNDGAADQHLLMFSGASGKFMPPPPDLFGPWQYYNGADGVFVWIESDKSDAYITSALSKLDAKFSTCEADVIDATGGVEALDSVPTAGIDCPNGSQCFRLWIVSNAATETLVNVDTGCD